MSELTSLLELGAPLAAVAGGAAYARHRTPRLYWSAVGLPAALVRIQSKWDETMSACELSVSPSLLKIMAADRAERSQLPHDVPKLRSIRPSTIGVRLRVRLARGLTTDAVRDASEALRHAWQVNAVYVSEVRPGIVDLHLVGFDVLRRVVLPSRMASKAAGLLRVPIALREDGTVFVRDYRTAPHGLALGATDSGKSMYARNLFAGLAGQPVALAGIDCKRGVEQAPFASRLSALATEPDAALDLLRVLVEEEMDHRYDLIRDHLGIPGTVAREDITANIWGLPDDIRPAPLVLVVDEIAELFLSANKVEDKRRNETVTLLIRYAQLARATGMYLEVLGQRFGAELGKGATALRAQLTHRVVHRVNDIETARMGLGDISEQAMTASTQIPSEQPGTAIAGDSSGRWSRIRTPYLSLADASARCARHAHLVPDLPALDAFRPVPPPVEQSNAVPLVKPRTVPVTE
ncbi:FtsK/SpoIIIE domain-containing protein [Actinacidiphila soli]|uniref:FtsK/SpoIIIE domain-containing protein n=1 Tax=Actinacidiphila soli TaxID=2487275 RepID=UPI000FC9FB41|nr:FtsK/SpoIIIE domain-containing protein [Actinacidiphila soli]